MNNNKLSTFFRTVDDVTKGMEVLYFQLPVCVLEELLRRPAILCSPDQAPATASQTPDSEPMKMTQEMWKRT